MTPLDLDTEFKQRYERENQKLLLTKENEIKHLEEELKAKGISGNKCLIIFVNIIRIKRWNPSLQKPVGEIRNSADEDVAVLREFQKRLDCAVLPNADFEPAFPSEVRTKEDFERCIKVTKHLMNSGRFEVLFWIMSGHGAQGTFGHFLWDAKGAPMYVSHDLVTKFAVDYCPSMRGKTAIFSSTAARVHQMAQNCKISLSLKLTTLGIQVCIPVGS